MNLASIDHAIIKFFRHVSIPLARLGLFIVFFWFGALKVVNLSPASPLVRQLFERTISGMTFDTFLVLFGILECLIGILFLVPGLERLVIPLLAFHMTTTAMPLFLLTSTTWSGVLVPTLEGQYIIKNILLIAAAIGIASHLHPLRSSTKT
jgi:uncharacterized membrane protein YkgB